MKLAGLLSTSIPAVVLQAPARRGRLAIGEAAKDRNSSTLSFREKCFSGFSSASISYTKQVVSQG